MRRSWAHDGAPAADRLELERAAVARRFRRVLPERARDATARRALRARGARSRGALLGGGRGGHPAARPHPAHGERNWSCACSAAGRCCASARRRPLWRSPVSRAASRSPAGSSPEHRVARSRSRRWSSPSWRCGRRSKGSSRGSEASPAGRPGRVRSTATSQRRIHTGVSRRYFRRLIAEGPR